MYPSRPMLRALLICVLCAGANAALARAPSPSFEEIIAPADRSHEASCALMAAWVDAHPADPRAPRGLLWMAQLRIADHNAEQARSLFLQVSHDYPGTEWALHGCKGLADLDLAARHYAKAIAAYESLARSGVPFFRYVGTLAARQTRAERLRFFLMLSLTAGFILLWVARLLRQAAWRMLWPPPAEILYPLPLLLLLAAASRGQPVPEGHAVLLLALGSGGLLWLNGAYLRAHPPKGPSCIVHGVLGLLQSAALLYVVIVLTGLWEKFHETLVMGAD